MMPKKSMAKSMAKMTPAQLKKHKKMMAKKK